MIALSLALLLADVGPAASLTVEGQAQEAASLQTFLQSAEKMNIDQRITDEQLDRAAAEFNQAWSALLPSLTTSAGWQYNQITAIIPATPPIFPQPLTIIPQNQLSATFRFELPLIDSQKWLRSAVTSAAKDAALSRDRLSIDTVHRNTISAYYGYVASLSVLQSSKKSVGVAEAQLKLVQINNEVGTSTLLELLRARAELERTRQTVADAQSIVAISARSLRTLSGIQPSGNIVMPPDDLHPEPAFGELETRLGVLPAVIAADFDYSAARRTMWQARLAIIPTVSAQFSEQFTNATGFQGKVALYYAGLNLTWRLDGPTFLNMEVQRAVAETQSLNAEKARLNARDQIHSDWQRLTAAITKVQAAGAQVVAAQKAQQVAQDRYQSGATTQLEVIQSDRDMFSAEVSQIQARTDLAIARASLHISAGLPLP